MEARVRSDMQAMEARVRSDMQAMEARAIKREDLMRIDMQAMEARTMRGREDVLGEKMMGFTFLTVGLGQVVPVLTYLKSNEKP